MLVVFGNGKCPLCGDNGRKIEKKTFHCPKCNVAFDDFMISQARNSKKYADKYWN